jgi:hypothetical protein
MERERSHGIHVYEGRQLDTIALPIGGIVTVCISLGG